MSGFASILGDWHLYVLFIAYYAFAGAIGAMPSPDSASGKGYAWFFKFANSFAANLSRAAQGKVPGVDVMPAPKPDTLNTTVPAPIPVPVPPKP